MGRREDLLIKIASSARCRDLFIDSQACDGD